MTGFGILDRWIIGLALLAAGCAAAPATQPIQTTSAWGPQINGLRARFSAPAEIEHNALLAVSFELQSDPASVLPGVTGFDRYLVETHLRLTLTSVATGRPIEIGPYEFSGPSPGPNRGQDASPLDQSPIKPVQTEFPLRSAGEKLKPGEYDCVVSYSSERGDRGYTQATRPRQLWAGELRTAPMRLIVKPEIVRPVTFLVPKRLHLTADLRVVFLPEDAERVTADLGNGMFLGTRITCRAGSQEISETLHGGPPQPGGPNPIDNRHFALEAHPPGGQTQYIIEIFATADPPHHMWDPGPRSNDYRTLWQKQFVVPNDTPR
jgi:hypothetical protein